MVAGLRHSVRLLAIARTLARHGALQPLHAALADAGAAPPVLLAARLAAGFGGRPHAGRPGERLAAALAELGPAFIKFGQLLATRSDLLGEETAADLSLLQDRLEPFDPAAARATIEAELGRPVGELFLDFDDRPVSAASIAQVHYATVPGENGKMEVAVKVLRPGIERAFARDIALLAWLARLIERTQPRLRRLKPTAVVATFAETVRVEMDLRLEAAAASELAANFAGDPTYKVPAVDWPRTARRVLTLARHTGIRIDDRAGLLAAGHDIEAVLRKAATVFFKQAFRDGYFHGDQHPGNMFVDAEGHIGTVDFGIMGRLDRKTRFYLADMLLAFLERDYQRLSEVHFAAGYVPAHHSPEAFALACRSVGEPIFGRPLGDISFARLLGQLFRLGEAFDMEVQPQLLLLQKNMLMAEGVSRQLAPDLNIWTLARPLIEEWMRENRGPEARLREAVGDLSRFIERLPRQLADIETAVKLAADAPRAAAERAVSPQWPLWLAIAALAALMLLG